MNCIEYCINRAKFNLNECFDDELVMMSVDISDLETKLNELRAERWGFASLELSKAGNPVIKVVDEPGFKKSLENENMIVRDIARNKGKFVELNPVFEAAQQDLTRFNKPTIKELRLYLQDCQNKVFELDRKLKDELHFRLTSSRARNQTMEQVIADPSFVDFKKKVEADIAQLKIDAEKAEGFITKTEGILRS